MEQISYSPIGTLFCSHTSPYEAPRQGAIAEQSQAYIEFSSKITTDAFNDLVGFSHIWVIYDFNQAKTWKPKVRPPRGGEKKRSVFATRSPYRPNSIGMSCVKLSHIKDHKIYISHHDLLNETPILDIKPYLAYADSVPEASKGWLKDIIQYKVTIDSDISEQIDWLSHKLGSPLEQTLIRQLEHDPTLAKAKRVKPIDNHYVFALKTWRFSFEVKEQKVTIFEVKSGYSQQELQESQDAYKDKETHREFINKFNPDLT